LSTKATTDFSTCTFTVKEFGDGTPFIMCEFDKPGIKALENGYIGFRFRERVTYEQAQKVVDMLRDQFEGISHTHFER
jgi:hypothetical protein